MRGGCQADDGLIVQYAIDESGLELGSNQMLVQLRTPLGYPTKFYPIDSIVRMDIKEGKKRIALGHVVEYHGADAGMAFNADGAESAVQTNVDIPPKRGRGRPRKNA